MQKLVPPLSSQLSLSLLPRTRLQITGWHWSQIPSFWLYPWKQLHSQLKTLHNTSALELPTTTNIHRKRKRQSLQPNLIRYHTCTLFLWLHRWTKSSVSLVVHGRITECPPFISAAIANIFTESNSREKRLIHLTIPGCRPSLQRRHNSRALKLPVISHPKPRAERDGFVYAFCLVSFLYSNIVQGPTPRNSLPHIQAWSSQINKQWKQSPTDMPMGQFDLDDSSLKPPSQTILGYVKLAN